MSGFTHSAGVLTFMFGGKNSPIRRDFIRFVSSNVVRGRGAVGWGLGDRGPSSLSGLGFYDESNEITAPASVAGLSIPRPGPDLHLLPVSRFPKPFFPFKACLFNSIRKFVAFAFRMGLFS